jgi:hypothetical protein
MKSATLSTPISTPVSPTVQAEAAAQLRMLFLALRDTMFEAEETSTRMSDVMIAVQKLVLKIEATMRPPNDAA